MVVFHSVDRSRCRARKAQLDKANALKQEGKLDKAAAAYGRAVSITPEMVAAVVHALRHRKRLCYVMAGEADAQAGHMFDHPTNPIHLVLTKDTDLVVHGCKRVTLSSLAVFSFSSKHFVSFSDAIRHGLEWLWRLF